MKEPNAPPRYGEALLNSAEKSNNVAEVLEGTRGVAAVVQEAPRMLEFLKIPQVAGTRKKDLLRKVFSDQLPEVLLNFMCLLVDRQRIESLLEIFDAFEFAYDARRGVSPVEVRTAVSLPEDLKPSMQNKLETMSGGPVRVEYVIDPSLIGGVIIMVGDTGTDIDGSIRLGLNRIRESLMKVKVN